MAAGALAGVLLAAACSSAAGEPVAATGKQVTLRLGYFPNLTHATAIVGVDKGIFSAALGSSVKLRTATFNAGPAAVTALLSGALDATYIGPGPSINAYAKSHGQAIRIVSGATSGGAALVVRPAISSAAALKGKKIASPQLGNTQDVALRFWLRSQGLHTDPQGGGDVSVVPQDNSQTLDTFASGQIDGAWVPEPYATRLVRAGGRVLVDERTLWPRGQFVTTQLIVRTAFLDQHPDVVQRLLAGQVRANDFVNRHPAEAQAVVNTALGQLTGKQLKSGVLSQAWRGLTFTNDPLASTLATEAEHAEAVGLLKRVDLGRIYDLRGLNRVLAAAGEPTVASS